MAGLACGVFSGLGKAQAVVVTHSVAAHVAPIVIVRDSGWTRSATDTSRVQWSGDIRANTAAELQVMGPGEREPVSYARSADGAWVQLKPGTWNTIAIAQPGRSRVAVQVMRTTVVHEPPAVRVVSR